MNQKDIIQAMKDLASAVRPAEAEALLFDSRARGDVRVDSDWVSRRITPSQINTLESGEIFVFGSNARGAHMGGAARAALENFGAIWGVGEGLQGRSYAIPTMEGLENLAPAVERFVIFARQHEELTFYVTAIGCGIAGYRPEQIAPLFLEAASLPNVYLPLSFWKVILNAAEG